MPLVESHSLRPACTLAVLLMAASGLSAAEVATIAVDPSTVHQTMAGWEATAWANQDAPEFPLFADGGPLAPPGPDCGPDPTADTLECRAHPGCASLP